MNTPELSLKTKTALITGATGGIGEAIANAFGLAGATVFLQGRNAEKLAALVRKFDEEGLETRSAALDSSRRGGCE